MFLFMNFFIQFAPLEGDQARQRQFHQQAKTGLSVEHLAQESFLRRWVTEHTRRGGTCSTAFEKQIEESNVITKKKHKQSHERAKQEHNLCSFK